MKFLFQSLYWRGTLSHNRAGGFCNNGVEMVKRVATIDIGTNSFLCLIADIEQKKIVRVVEDHCVLVRLGQGVNENKFFHPEALQRAEACLENFRERIVSCGVNDVKAVATSAARDVSNGNDLIEMGRKLEIPIEIIGGQREAELTYLGVDFSAPEEEGEGVLVLDIGGGSTECIEKNSGRINAQSVDVGGVRLTEMFISSHPINDVELQKMITYVREKMALSLGIMKKKSQVTSMIAVAGTPTTLAMIEIGEGFVIEKIENYTLSKKRIKSWIKTLSDLSVKERAEKFGIPMKRADILVAGSVLLFLSLEYWGLEELTVSTRGIRHGLIGEF